MNLRRSLVAVPAVLAISLGSLTACSSSGDTTCGEYKDKSTSERVDLLNEAADEEGGDAAKEWEALDDDAKALIADGFVAACDGVDDDTKLEDLE